MKAERLNPTYFEHEKSATRERKQMKRQDTNFAECEKATTR